MRFSKVVRDIKTLKIQGAQAVAETAVKALRHVVHSSRAHSDRELLAELGAACRELVLARPTEPCMRNALAYVLDIKGAGPLVKELDSRIRQVTRYFLAAERRIAEIGANKVRKGMVVFTHCHSSTVMMVLAKAKFSRKSFEVHNTETRPMLQGRKTAKELAALKIPIRHFVDSAARYALKNADLFLFGADAVQSDGTIVNKIGTELFLEIARKYEIPSYCCTVSWKFDPKSVYGIDEPMENRNRAEVWKNVPKRVVVMNPAFERIDPMLVTGVISEFGIFRPGVFVDEVCRANPWMLRR